MKSIILNLLKQGYDFFAVALTTGFIFSFFFPIKHFLLFTIAVVIADTMKRLEALEKMLNLGLIDIDDAKEMENLTPNGREQDDDTYIQ